ncbi:peptidase M41 [Acidovorax delafieldii 2AN]|uniref:Peptidase M41 n=1 Tax=Acidovorax delafieldii 2AN TaxID=573060 RepID=C5T6H9_ACIDE|nr:peptidase M41 [Acidovorax delafieldii]EER59923.1 peptidase M41 [Acidovorax delafieldii 2AN]
MQTNNIPLHSHISERSAQLRDIAAELKTELLGIDDVIDRVMDTVRAWYVLPEIINRPVIVNLWGLTGTGKTQLIRSLSKKLGFYDRLIEVQMDGYSNGGGMSVGSMLSDSAITEGMPGILVLDEFQRFRTVDLDGRERKVEHYMDVWGLLSDGKLPPNISFLGDMERRLAEAAYREEYKRLGAKSDADEDDVVVERLFARQPHNDQSKFALSPYQAQEFKTTLKLRESIMEIMTWSPQDLHGRLVAFMQDPHAWESDYSKLLIFVCGNLDEMYVDAASRVEDCDTDADVFHAMTRKLSLIDVKRALSERFKPEQIARLGNNHVVYPSLNRATYQKLIEVAVRGYLEEIEASSGLRFEVSDAVREQIYVNAVFPTQGTRPVFSSVHGLMSAPLVDFTLWALEQGAAPGQVLSIDVNRDAGLLVTRWGDRMHTVPVAFEISKLRQRTDPDMRAILAVHEAGHGLIYALLFQQAPLEIRINMATFSGGYNSFNALKVKTRGNLLDAVCVALAGRAAEEMVFGKEFLSSGSESDLKLATQQMAAFIRHAAFGKRISHVDVSTEAGENINTDVASTNAEIEAGLLTQYERAQGLLTANKVLYLRMVNELVNKGQLEPQQIREWLGLAQQEAQKDALEPFEAKLREFERRAA